MEDELLDELSSEVDGALGSVAAAVALGVLGWRIASKAVTVLSDLIKKTIVFFGFKGAVTVEGMKEAAKQLEKQKKEKANAIIQGLIDLAEIIKKRALYYCPIDTGELRKSVKVKFTGGSSNTASLSIQFGNKKAFYALYVHEDLTKYHAPPTQAKFLERAIDESRSDIVSVFGSGFSNRMNLNFNGGLTTVESVIS